jgi:hypothetical protein
MRLLSWLGSASLLSRFPPQSLPAAARGPAPTPFPALYRPARSATQSHETLQDGTTAQCKTLASHHPPGPRPRHAELLLPHLPPALPLPARPVAPRPRQVLPVHLQIPAWRGPQRRRDVHRPSDGHVELLLRQRAGAERHPAARHQVPRHHRVGLSRLRPPPSQHGRPQALPHLHRLRRRPLRLRPRLQTPEGLAPQGAGAARLPLPGGPS